MTRFEHDTAKLTGLARKLPSADIAVQFGRSPTAPAVKVPQLKLSLKQPENSKRNHSNPDPGPSGFDWRHD
jgi:hypothetical protein